MVRYAYQGSAHLIDLLAPQLASAGFVREEDVAAAEVVITYCPSTSQLEDLYFGEAGIIQAADASSVIIDLSPTTPQFATEMLSLATISDLRMVEAPLVVIDPFAEDAFAAENLIVFAAGEDDALDAAQPALDAIAGETLRTGAPGSAQLRRAARTLQSSAAIVSAIESQALFDAAGKSVTRIVLAEGALEPISEEGRQALEAVRSQRFEGAYTTEMMMAELSAAIMAADDFEIIIPQAEAAFNMLELLAVIGGAGKSPAALSLVYGNEGDAAEHGLDWSRAEGYFAERAHEHDHPHAHGDADYDDADYDALDDFDDGFDYLSN